MMLSLDGKFKWYRPMEVAKLGLIQNSRGINSTVKGRYNFILELIRSNKLTALDYAKGSSKRPFYLISELEIKRYHETMNKMV